MIGSGMRRLQYFRVARPQVLQQQAVAGVAHEVVAQVQPLQRSHRGIRAPFVDQQAEALEEIVGPEIGEAGALTRGGEHAVDAEFDLQAGCRIDSGLLRRAEARFAQVVDPDRMAHGESAPS